MKQVQIKGSRLALETLIFALSWLVLFWLSLVYLMIPGISFCFLPTAASFFFTARHGLKVWPFILLGPLITGLVFESWHDRIWPDFWLDLRHAVCFGGAGLLFRKGNHQGYYFLNFRRETALWVLLALSAGLVSALWATWTGKTSLNTTPAASQIVGYWIGDTNGILLLMPLLVLVFRPSPPPVRTAPPKIRTSISALFLFAATVFSIWLGFGLPTVFGMKIQLWYVSLLPLAAAALYFGPSGIALCLVTGSVMIISLTGLYGLAQSIIELQLFILISAIFGYLLAAAEMERQVALASLALERSQLESKIERRTQSLRKEVQTRKLAEEKAHAASKAKSIFLANMSHEIRTPMNGLLGMLQLLKETTLTHDQKEYLKLAQFSGKNLTQILNDILDVSKIEAGKMILEKKPFSLRNLIEDLASLFALQAREKGLELTVLVAKDVPKTVLGDKLRIRQILANVINNAMKFTQEGSVDIRLEREQEVKMHMQRFHLRIRDTGIGISQEQQFTIFTPFAQADTSTTRQYGGTGLGLSIVKQLTSLMGGEITLESKPGKGSCFHIYLPLPEVEPFVIQPFKGGPALLVTAPSLSSDYLTNYLDMLSLSPERITAETLATRLKQRTPTGTALPFIFWEDTRRAKDESHPADLLGLCQSRPIILIGGFDRSDLVSPNLIPLGIPITLKTVVQALNQCLGKEKTPNQTISPDQPLSQNREKRILLAEDNDVNARLMQHILARLNLACTRCHNGREAIKAANETRWDIILMDCQMPEIDGFQATQSIRSQGLNKETPIIAITAGVMASDRQACFDVGMNDFLPKPIHFTSFHKVLDRWLNIPAGTASENQEPGSTRLPSSPNEA